MSKTSMQIFLSSISIAESRLIKTCDSIVSLNLVDEVIIIGYWEEGLELETQLSSNIKVIRVKTLIKRTKFRKGILRKFIVFISFIGFHLSVIKRTANIRPDFISCHNLQLLPLCALLKWFYKVRLFYEPHELETEKTGINERFKFIFKFIEKKFIKYCNKVVTVCEPISDYYKQKYDLNCNRVLTIRNVPVNPSLGKLYKKTDLFRHEFDIPNESIIFLYQGLISKHRGIFNYLDTFVKLDNNYHLVIMGYGEEELLVKEYSIKYNNIHFKQAVAVNKIIKYTSSADVGLHIIPGNLSMSYQFSLPNKFYEYAIAGLHICVADNFTFLKKIVNDEKLGSVISSNDDGLFEWIKNIRNNKRMLLIPSTESIEFRINCGWQNEERNFIKLYS